MCVIDTLYVYIRAVAGKESAALHIYVKKYMFSFLAIYSISQFNIIFPRYKLCVPLEIFYSQNANKKSIAGTDSNINFIPVKNTSMIRGQTSGTRHAKMCRCSRSGKIPM